MNDLFETPDLIPDNVKSILSTHDENVDQYKELTRLVTELEKVGYTFEYYLDAEPFALRPIEIPLNKIVGYENE